MTKKHKGAGTGRQGKPGTHRGPETGNGFTASTGHTDKAEPVVTFLSALGEAIRGKKKKK